MTRQAAILFLILATIAPTRAAEPEPIDGKLLDTFTARNIGPANMSGRVTAIAVLADRPATMYVAAASGGVWKTTNAGTTWTPVFDEQPVSSIGDVAVAPSNPDVVWVGTGEANARNSVSWGDGVYKSTDAGKTWTNMGLKDTQHIGRIVIHPKGPDTVYVAAVGHLWASNRQRGVFKTTDGGKTWDKVLYLNDETGAIDLAMDPSDPDVLYATAYRVRRGPFDGGNPATLYGKDAGLYKTIDGGKAWVKLANGLPEIAYGRCGISIYRKDPRIVYAIIQTEKTDIRVTAGQPPKASAVVETGGVFRSEDGGESWVKVNDLCPRPFYFGQIRVDPTNDQRVYVFGVPLFLSTDGGKTFHDDGGPGVHSDQHALWIDPKDSDHMVVGCDGGLFVSRDKGKAWEHSLNLPIAQFYGIAVDMRKPYRVYGGLQDNGSWAGASATRNPEGITIADWSRILGADGFQCQVDTHEADVVYAETQYGGLTRVNVRSGDNASIRPRPAREEPEYRFNWNAPMLLSSHNPRIVYFGGNHVFRSLNRGDKWETLSKDLTQGKPGPSSEFGHTITTLAESPVKAGVLWAGTDDGRLHVTRNGGGDWTELTEKIPDLPSDRWISRIECSHFEPGTAYVAIDRHRNDDRKPYLFKTTDHGATWASITGDLPDEGPVRVIREDLQNKSLLFAGTEFGLYVSLNDGVNWQRFKNGLPAVAVHDLVIHPRDRELVIGTHGRGIYVVDVAPLEHWPTKLLDAPAHLFDVKPATLFQYHGSRGLNGGKNFAAPNPAFGATITYYLREKPLTPVRLSIVDAVGNVIATLNGAQEAGLHRAVWNLRANAEAGPMRSIPPVTPGDYAVKLELGDQTWSKKVRVEADE
jgi:photosystem II stability/assembly factor-like uncharacterized protein